MNPLELPLLPPKLALRALDDLHTIARAAGGVTDRLDRLDQRLEAIEGRVGAGLDLAREVEATALSVLELGEKVDDRLARLLTLGRQIDRRAASLLDLGAQVDARAADLLTFGEQVDERVQAVLSLGEGLEERAGEVLVLGGTLQQLAVELLEQARTVSGRADAVARVGGEVVAALPTLEKAVLMATPLEGAVERVGRLVDRLPGGPRPARDEEDPPGPGPD